MDEYEWEDRSGTVVSIRPGKALVRLDVDDDSCTSCHSCALNSLCTSKERGKVEVVVDTDSITGAAIDVGDAVRIEYRPFNRAVAAVILFVPALLGLLAGGWFAAVVWPEQDLLLLAGCAVGLIIGLAITFIVSRLAGGTRPRARLAAVTPIPVGQVME
ncbi:MAG: SoxR reducing system RseC family protein [Planctomycetes bacterium]|nr:SoxR reducing system RseC family protein [Planctomycetota bacterium]